MFLVFVALIAKECYYIIKSRADAGRNPAERKGVMDKSSLHDYAAALHDGGWRAEDKEELIQCYEMDPEDVEQICEVLAQWESEGVK